MTDRVIIDAGPALNFFSINKERVLLDAIGQIAAPESVADEVIRKARQDARFQVAGAVWTKLEKTAWLEILSDSVTPQLAAAVERITSVPIAERIRQSKDLGEVMVLAHAATQADGGHHVVVLIDDGRGADLAGTEAARLRRLSAQGRIVGTLSLMNTHTVLERAAGRKYVQNRNAMRRIYAQLRQCVDGLVDIKQTDLLSKRVWGDG